MRNIILNFLCYGFIVLLLATCNGPINENKESASDFSLQEIPRYAKPGGQTSKAESSASNPDYFTCVVSTLMEPGSNYSYEYRTFKIVVPESMAEQEKKLFVFTYGASKVPEYADKVEGLGGISRIAHCQIPDNPDIKEWLKKQFLKYGSKSWFAYLENNPKDQDENNLLDTRYVCDLWEVTRRCMFDENNEIIDGTCVNTTYECLSWHIEYDEDSPGGGGGSIGGGGSDPCEECEPDMPCDNTGSIQNGDSISNLNATGCSTDGGGGGLGDICDYSNAPEICGILDPCSQVNNLEGDVSFIAKFDSLEWMSRNVNHEGAFVYREDTYGKTYEYLEGGGGNQYIDIPDLSYKADGLIHSHFIDNETLSIFSPSDIQAIWGLYLNGDLNDLRTFTLGVVTPYNTAYLLKIDDVEKFMDFGEEFLVSSSPLSSDPNVLLGFYDQVYGINSLQSPSQNEKYFLKLLDGLNTGLKLFKGTPSLLNSWQLIDISEDGQVINTNCN